MTSCPVIISSAALSLGPASRSSYVDNSFKVNKKTPAFLSFEQKFYSFFLAYFSRPSSFSPRNIFIRSRTRIYSHFQPPLLCMPSTTPSTPVAQLASTSLNALFLDAVIRGDDHGVRSLLERGANVNATDAKGRSAVACAVAGERYAHHEHFEPLQVLNTVRSSAGRQPSLQ